MGLSVMAVAGILLLRALTDSGGDGPVSLFSSDHDTDLLAWAPPDSEMAAGINIKELNAYGEFRELLLDRQGGKVGPLGFSADSIDRVLVIGPADRHKDDLLVYRLKRAYDPNVSIRAGSAKPKTQEARRPILPRIHRRHKLD